MIGQHLRVIGSRKIATGTVGRCIWVGHTKYGPCVRLEVDNGGTSTSIMLSTKSVEPLVGRPVQQGLFEPPLLERDHGNIPF